MPKTATCIEIIIERAYPLRPCVFSNQIARIPWGPVHSSNLWGRNPSTFSGGIARIPCAHTLSMIEVGMQLPDALPYEVSFEIRRSIGACARLCAGAGGPADFGARTGKVMMFASCCAPPRTDSSRGAECRARPKAGLLSVLGGAQQLAKTMFFPV